MWPVRPLNELAPVPDQPLKMPLRLLAELDVQCVRIGCFGAHAEPYGTAGEVLPQAQSSAAGTRSGYTRPPLLISSTRYVGHSSVVNRRSEAVKGNGDDLSVSWKPPPPIPGSSLRSDQ